MKMMLALGLSACLASAALIAQARSAADLYQEGLQLEEVKGDLQKAIATYHSIVERAPADRGIAAKAQLHIGLCYERMGKAEASKAYETVIREYADQKDPAAQAKLRLASLGGAAAQPSEAAVVARQVWSGSDVDLEGKPSTDGRLITFIDWTSTRSGNVAVRNLTTGENRTLTHSSSFAEGFGEYPVLSPDGRQVIFGWYNDDGQFIKVASSDGSRSRVLVHKPGVYAYELAWSPDGRQVAAIMDNFGGDKTSQIALISASDGSITPLKSMGWRPTSLGGFSPDGRFLVYSVAKSGSDTETGIYSIAVDGSRESVLVKGAANDSSPVWTPDGTSVVFVSDRSGTAGLWSIRVADGQSHGSAELVRPNMGQIFNMGFARDGSYFYGTRNDQTDVFEAAIDPQTLQIAAQPAPARMSDRFVGFNSGPAWSPDGRFVAFLRGEDRRTKSLIVRTVADGTERTLATKFIDSYFAAQMGPTWFPDSRSMIVPDTDAPNQRSTFRRVEIESGKETSLFEARYRSIWPLVKMAPDGKSLYYTTSEPSANPEENILHLVRRDIETGKEIELYRVQSGGVGLFGLCVSPDGTQLAFMLNVPSSGANRSDEGRRVLMTMPSSGGAPRELYKGDYSHPSPFAGVWTKDGRHVLVTTVDTARRMRVWAFPAAGGEPKKLDLTMERMSALDLSPDGRRLIFTGTQTKPELWTITNLIPTVRTAR